MTTQVPPAGISVKRLRKYVADQANLINAILNMTVVVEGKDRMTGKLFIQGDSCVLRINQPTEIGTDGG